MDSIGTNYVARFRHSTATGYAPGSILLEAGQGTSRGQGIYHYNNVADENWFTGVPYNVNSKKWIVANKYSTIQSVDTAQLTHALMTIDSDTGNVGIGTTSPGAKLEISHSGSNNGLLLENTLNSSNYQIALNIRENEGLIFQRWTGVLVCYRHENTKTRNHEITKTRKHENTKSHTFARARTHTHKYIHPPHTHLK